MQLIKLGNNSIRVRPLLKFGTYLLLATGLMISSMPTHANGVFVTTPGSGPDKWASAWLLSRHNNAASVSVIQTPEHAEKSQTLFDAKGAPFDRTGSSTTYSSLIEAFGIADETAIKLGELVHEIEIDAWRMEVSMDSQVLENSFRGMQVVFGRERVTQECYMRFFDRAASAIKFNMLETASPEQLKPDASCLGAKAQNFSQQSTDKVSTLPLDALMRRIGDGEKIVFVDTRERWEYNEGHIPGAINLKLRDVSSDAVLEHKLNEADHVIAYCVKDFRGYEVAKALRDHGVSASIIKPHGMRGWIAAGLPVSGQGQLNTPDGIKTLRSIARTPGNVQVQ